MPVFPTSFLDDVRQADMLAIIGASVDLRNTGGRWFGCCPFHQEKTPSFSVNPAKGFYYCFGCRDGGDIISFVQKFDGVSFMEAVERIAGIAGLSVPKADPAKAREEEELYETVSTASRFFRSQYEGSPSAVYMESRGFDIGTARAWGLGHAGKPLVTMFKGDESKLLRAGLASYRGGRTTEMFGGRLIFPISDGRGNEVTLAGRSLRDSGAKYINGRDSRVFRKGHTLFGLGMSEPHFKEEGFGVLVEGYTDVMRLHQKGMRCAFASMGTAFTPQHARVIKKKIERIVVMTDGDTAGRKSSFKSVLVLFDAGLDPVVCPFDEGDDPDSFVSSHGIDSLRARVASSVDGVAFLVNEFVARSNMTTAASRAKASGELAELVSGFQEESVRREVFESFAEHAKVKPAELEERAAEVASERRAPRAGVVRSRVDASLRTESYLLGLLLRSREEFSEFSSLIDSAQVRYFRIGGIVERMLDKGWAPAGELLSEATNPDSKSLIEASASMPNELLDSLSVEGCWSEMKSSLREKRIDQLSKDIASSIKRGDFDAAEVLEQERLELRRLTR